MSKYFDTKDKKTFDGKDCPEGMELAPCQRRAELTTESQKESANLGQIRTANATATPFLVVVTFCYR